LRPTRSILPLWNDGSRNVSAGGRDAFPLSNPPVFLYGPRHLRREALPRGPCEGFGGSAAMGPPDIGGTGRGRTSRGNDICSM
jgi:hypothetical protein